MTVYTSKDWLLLPITKKIEILVEYHMEFMVFRISVDEGITKEEAKVKFKSTKTFTLLMNEGSKLYLESSEYVLDMYKCEIEGNWDEWLKI